MQDSDFADSLLFVTVCYTTASFVGEYFLCGRLCFSIVFSVLFLTSYRYICRKEYDNHLKQGRRLWKIAIDLPPTVMRRG